MLANLEEDITSFITSMIVVKRMRDRKLTRLTEEYRLSPICLEILAFLAQNPNFNTATSIIENRHFTKSHVSNALKLLEQRGYITRFYTGTNHKTIYLSLTHESLEVVEAIRENFDEFCSCLTRDIPEQDIERAVEVLKAIARNASEMDCEHHA